MSGRVSEEGTISVSTAKWYNPIQYREKLESIRGAKNCPDEYRMELAFSLTQSDPSWIDMQICPYHDHNESFDLHVEFPFLKKNDIQLRFFSSTCTRVPSWSRIQ